MADIATVARDVFQDITICTKDGRKINADRLIVGTRIDGLQEMMQQSVSGATINWPCLNYEAANTWISFAYTQKLEISEANVAELFLISIILNDSTHQKECWEIIKKRMTVESVGKMIVLTSFAPEKLFLNECLDFVKEKLKAEDSKKKMLLNFDVTCMRHILIPEMTTKEKFVLINYWMTLVKEKFIEAESLNNFAKLIEVLDWTFMPSTMIDETMSNFSESARKAMNALAELQPHINLVAVAERANVDMLGHLLRMHPLNGITEHSTVKLGYFRRFGITELNGFVYVIGGFNGDTLKEVFAIEVESSKIRQVESLAGNRCFPGVSKSKEELVVCGGTIFEVERLNTCEVYNVKDNKWSSLPNMQERRLKCAVVWMPNGMIYAIGGMANNGRVKSVEVLSRPWTGAASADSSQSKWRFVAPMNIDRNFHSAANIGDQIIVVGGFFGVVGIRTDIVELFTPPTTNEELGQWTIVCTKQPPDILLDIYFRCDMLHLLYNEGYENWKLKSDKTKKNDTLEFEFGNYERWTWNPSPEEQFYIREAVIIDTRRPEMM